MATLKAPDNTKRMRMQTVTGADSGDLRELTVPGAAASVLITVLGAGGPIDFWLEGEGADDDPRTADAYPVQAGTHFPYTTDIGAQQREPGQTGRADWNVYVSCDENAASIHVITSYHRNN